MSRPGPPRPTAGRGASQAIPTPGSGRDFRVGVALVLLVLVVFGPFVKVMSAQAGSRLSLTAAVVDHGSIEVTGYEAILTQIDRLEVDGRLYSDKAPGQPFAAVPFYATARAVGADPAELIDPRDRGHRENLTAWWVTLWTSVVPAAGLFALVAARARRHHGRAGIAATSAIAFSTLFVPIIPEMYGHLLAAFLGYAMWYLASNGPPDLRRVVVCGALGGAAVIVEYPMIIVVVVVGLYLVRTTGVRALGALVLGGLPFAAGLALYQSALVGNPFSPTYAQKPSPEGDPFYGRILPDIETLIGELAGSRGMFILTPIMIFAVAGMIAGLRDRRGGDRADLMWGGAIFLAYLLAQATWPNPWGGEVPGPRYVLVAYPFVVVGLARSWTWLPAVRNVTIAIGVGTMGLGLVADSHLVPHGAQVVNHYVAVIEEDGLAPTLFTMAMGRVGWLAHVVLVAAATWFLVATARSGRVA